MRGRCRWHEKRPKQPRRADWVAAGQRRRRRRSPAPPAGTKPRPGLQRSLPWLPCRCSLLSPTDLAAVACTHRAWRQAVEAEEPLWRALCEAEFCLTTPCTPDRQPLPTFRAAYGAWRASFAKYGSLATRALRAWRKVEEWAAQHFPAVAASLRCGGCGLREPDATGSSRGRI